MHAEGNALNKKAEQVNALIRQVRKTQGWLSDRERKISKLQSIIQQSAVSEGSILFLSTLYNIIYYTQSLQWKILIRQLSIHQFIEEVSKTVF